jgi:hypothetical protein
MIDLDKKLADKMQVKPISQKEKENLKDKEITLITNHETLKGIIIHEENWGYEFVSLDKDKVFHTYWLEDELGKNKDGNYVLINPVVVGRVSPIERFNKEEYKRLMKRYEEIKFTN